MADEDELVPEHTRPDDDPVNPQNVPNEPDLRSAVADPAGAGQAVIAVNIEEEMRRSYLDYAMSVIISRALPDARDGLKPVQRRILMAMHDLNLTPGAQHRKSAKIAGDTSGNYHPHGEAVVYPTMVRMAQTFSLRYPLVDGQGNFGSIDGDPPAAMRYCVTADTLVVTDQGLARMGALAPAGGGEDVALRVLSHGRVENSASKWFDSGEHPTWRVRTRHGYEVTGTSNHPLLVLRAGEGGRPSYAWKTIAELEAGDALVVDRSNQMWPEAAVDLGSVAAALEAGSLHPRTRRHALPAELSEDLAFLLGALTAEGTVRRDNIEFTNTPGDYADAFRDAWARVFPDCRLHQFLREPAGYGKKPFWQMQVVSQQVVAFFRALGLDGKSGGRRVPDAVLRSPRAVAAAFLRGLFEGDGAVERSGRSLLRVSLCSHSDALLRDAQTLLLRFGIVASRWSDAQRGGARLGIVGADNLRAFQAQIGFASGVKRAALTEVLALHGGAALSRMDFVPLLAAYVRQRATRHREWLSKNNFDRSGRLVRAMPRLEAALASDAADLAMLAFLARADYLYDPVVAIEDAGVRNVYSIRVDSACHSFVANGLVNHNTEARMSQFGNMMLADLDKDTVDWTENYDQTRQEPLVLPSAFPNLLCNGGEGIAVGMATKMPPHNLREVVDALIHLIDKPQASIADLMEHVKGPDFPTSGMILGLKGIRSAYETGRGSVVMQAKTSIEEGVNGRSTITIHEIPYQVNKTRLIEQIADLVKQKKLEGIADINDFTDRTGIQVVITLKRDAYPKKVLNFLLKHTPLRLTFGVNMLALHNNQPRILNLKQALEIYVEHRREVVRRRTEFDLNRYKRDAHLLEGLQIAIDVLDELIALIRAARTPDAARSEMMERFGLSQIQADAVLAMQLRRLTALERERLESDYKDILKQIAYLEDILASFTRLNQIVKQELRGLRDKYGDERKTRIIPMEAEEIGEEDMIPEEEMIISITRDGYIKRVPKETYPTQRRGGRGRIGAATKDEDKIQHLFIATTHDHLLFFTDRGRVYRLKAYEVPQTSRQAMGTAVINLINIVPGEKITATVPMRDYKSAEGYLLFATERGEVKRTAIADFVNLRANGLICFDIEENDALRWVAHTSGQDEIVMVTRKAMSISFNESTVPVRGRGAGGVRGIKLSADKDDRVVGMGVIERTSDLLVIGELGIGKRTGLKDYRMQGRGGVGIRTMGLTAKTGEIVDAKVVTSDDRLLIMTRNGVTININVSDLRTIGRSATGVRMINLDEGDAVATVEKLGFDKEGNEEIE